MSEKTHCETEVPNSFPQVIRVRKHVFRTDVSESAGSTDSAPGAHDYFDAALAACKTPRPPGMRVRIRFRWKESKSTSSGTTRRNARESTS